jgi:hypothetical protein
MRNTIQNVATLLATAVLVPAAEAQKTTVTGPGRGGSPHVRSEWVIDSAQVAISYGRPYLKGRPESQMMPAGQVWRTGADTATILITNRMLRFGTVTIAPGSYTLNTQPGATEWQLIFGSLSSPGQWGIPYQPELEMSRAPMKVGKAAAPREQLTISIDDTREGAILRIEWGATSASIPFSVVPG